MWIITFFYSFKLSPNWFENCGIAKMLPRTIIRIGMFKIYEDWDDVVILKIPRLRINEEGKLAGCGQDYIETHYQPPPFPVELQKFI